MSQHKSGFILIEVLSFLFLVGTALPADAVECLSPSYSVQKGRDFLVDVEPRNLIGNEYQDLKELFQGLSGDWTGSGQSVSCLGPVDEIRKETENYTVTSKGKTDSEGQFTLESALYFPEKRTKQNETFRLFLGQERLATRPDTQLSDIELVSVSQDELTFVKKNRAKAEGFAFVGQEVLISLKKSGVASFVVENSLFVNGRLTAFSAWQLERN